MPEKATCHMPEKAPLCLGLGLAGKRGGSEAPVSGWPQPEAELPSLPSRQIHSHRQRRRGAAAFGSTLQASVPAVGCPL